MSWLNFLAPGWAFMGLLAVPIVLLYLLRQKRPDLPISSTILWSKALADMRASTPFQKLRRNLLLFLQLLILAALVLTLMRPIIQARASTSEAGVIVIDATASMQTHDEGAAESRLDRAKEEAKKLVDRMRPGDQYMLIADGGGMHQVSSGFTSSKSELKSLIDSVRPSDTSSDLSESLLVAITNLRAKGASGPGGKNGALAPGQIWLFSDGSNIHVPDAIGEKGNAGGGLQFVRIGTSDHSVGITRLSITPVPKQEHTYEVFVGLRNDWSIEKKFGVLLAYGAKDNFMPNQAKFVTLPPNATGSAVFEDVSADPAVGGGKLFARVDDTDDDFPLDNTAYGIIAPPRKPKVVLITPGNEFLEHMLETAVTVGIAEAQVLDPKFYKPDLPADLFIFDGFLPPADRLPKVDTLFIAPTFNTPPGADSVDIAGFRIHATIERPVVLRWKREEPVMKAIQDLGDLYIGHALLMDHDNSAVELVSAPEGPLIAYKDFGPARRYFISFNPLLESNWHRLPSLLMFLQNTIEQTGQRHFIGMPQLVTAGNPARLWSPDPVTADTEGQEVKVRVTLPDDSVMEVPARDGAAEFGATDKLGFYEETWPAAGGGGGGGKKSLFAVNLLSPSESDIRPQALQVPEGSNLQEHANVTVENREIWRWLAAAALIVLMVEWWAYHRRVA